MTLLEAFQELAPVTDDLSPELRARRQDAAVIVLRELQSLAPKVTRVYQDVDDLVSSVLSRLLTSGPKGRDTAGLPSRDGEVRSYLFAAVRNALRDRHRQGSRTALGRADSLDDQVDDALLGEIHATGRGGASNPEQDALVHERAQLVREASRLLYDCALPALALEAVRQPDEFVQTVCDIRDLTREVVTIDELIAREGLPPGLTSQNRLYQRHRRARPKFLEWLRPWLAAAQLSDELDLIVRRVAHFDMTARVVRGRQPS